MEATVVSDKDKFKAFHQNMEWFRAHYGQLKRDHPDKFVAIRNGKVTSSDKTLEGLLGSLRKKYSDISSFAIEFVSSSEAELILL